MRKRSFVLILLAMLCYGCPKQIKAQSFTLSPEPSQQFLDNTGKPLAGGKIYTCVAGLACPGNPQATFTDASGGTPLANPIILSAGGFPQNSTGGIVGIWLQQGLSYKIVVENSSSVIQYVIDVVSNPYTALGGVNTFTALNTFNGAVNLNSGGSMSGSFSGSPTFSGGPTFTGAPQFSGIPTFANGIKVDTITGLIPGGLFNLNGANGTSGNGEGIANTGGNGAVGFSGGSLVYKGGNGAGVGAGGRVELDGGLSVGSPQPNGNVVLKPGESIGCPGSCDGAIQFWSRWDGSFGDGFQSTSLASCTTGAAVGNTCDTTWTFITALRDSTHYIVTCDPQAPVNVPVYVGSNTQTASSVKVRIAALTAAAASATLRCMAIVTY